MATILLSAVGAAAGASIGGGVLGLSSAVIGRAVGATIGQAIDQRLMGSGSAVVETGRIDRFRLTGASEGGAVARLWGRMRLSGQVIWATRFKENVNSSGGSGKGMPKAPATRSYSYSISVAIALCEGEILRVGRVWADGTEIARDQLQMRVYTGSETQLPDPKISAVEGADEAPAYRGIAYVVLEDLDLAPYGNRLPQLSFEVVRAAVSGEGSLAGGLQGVALIPGTGEYALASTPVHFNEGNGRKRSANVHAPAGGTDFTVSLEALREELPECGSVLLVASWFGDDLNCNSCALRPKVEQKSHDGVGMPWRVSSLTRATAQELSKVEGRTIYGGTPSDASVIEAIRALRDAGKAVVFYPFILMEQLAGNDLVDPWTGAPGQPALPWRGRITTSRAPGIEGSPDGTAAAAAEVAAFFGTAMPAHFVPQSDGVGYAGPPEWSFRRMILHYARLCALAGGVDAFCIGSEMRALTQIRGADGTFPAVVALRALATDVRAVLGPQTRIGYAADWSEYFGYQPQDGSGDVYFHLDPLWADPSIDFIGIDNYMPVSDWRDGQDHLDAGWDSIYSLEYLKANVAGGEGYDWYYGSSQARDAQIRTPITDGAHGEPWVFRYKDIRSWWENPHHDRIGGVRQETPTDWQPRSKPVWFTEFGCAAVDKGTNQPNRFRDLFSSESGLPHYSNGRRDDLIQTQYLRAIMDYWSEPGNNPVSEVYGGPMVDTARAHAWAWDARPFPQFPARSDIWSDGGNYARGHWLNGRASAQTLGAVVSEICARAGVAEVDVEALYGLVRGYAVSEVTSARAVIQPLMLAHGFDAIEREGRLIFRSRGQRTSGVLEQADLAALPELPSGLEATRAAEAEVSGRVRVTFVEAEGDYEARAAEAVFPDDALQSVSQTELPLVLTASEGRSVAERWLAEARVARDAVRLALPPSRSDVGAGDVIRLEGARVRGLYRVDRVEQGGGMLLDATRVEPQVQVPADAAEDLPPVRTFAPPLPVDAVFLDLPLLTGDETPHAPHLAIAADPWPGSVAVYGPALEDAGYQFSQAVVRSAVMGETITELKRARPGLPDRGPALRVSVGGGLLASATQGALLSGANLAAVGSEGSGIWELLQFRDADLVAPGVYDLSFRLRGQLGTDATAPDVWPAGSRFVLMDGAPVQVGLPVSARNLARHYRIGPAMRSYDDPAFVHRVEAFAGIGLRPYAPVHLRANQTVGDDLLLTWVRRARLAADSWEGEDVPLGEAFERYRVRVVRNGAPVREATVSAPEWTYPASLRIADGCVAPFDIEVSQISDTFGPGPFARISIDE